MLLIASFFVYKHVHIYKFSYLRMFKTTAPAPLLFVLRRGKIKK